VKQRRCVGADAYRGTRSIICLRILGQRFRSRLRPGLGAEYRDRGFGKSNELRPRRKRFRNRGLIRIWMAIGAVRLPDVLIAAECDHGDRSSK
jgi:hypothetical protein